MFWDVGESPAARMRVEDDERRTIETVSLVALRGLVLLGTRDSEPSANSDSFFFFF